MVTAATKFLFPTVVHAMARHKMRDVKMVGAKITVVANLGAISSAATIAAVKAEVAMKVAAAITVAAKPALATNVAGHRSRAANPEQMASARATMAQSQPVLVGIRML